MTQSDPLSRMFTNLDRWRHFPDYQLERRADIFFSVYLAGLLEEFTDRPMMDMILPEFPVKLDLVCAKEPSGRSVKVDYVLFSQNREMVYFVELKTDQGSFDADQHKRLEAAKRVGFREILRGLTEIVRRTNSPQKYYHLLYWLCEAGFLELPPDIEDYVYPEVKKGLKLRLDRIEVAPIDPEIQVVYILPHAMPELNCMDFPRIIGYLGRFDDDFTRLFAASLSRWQETAGAARSQGRISNAPCRP